MIVRPSTPQLVDALRHELSETIAPQVTGATGAVTLAMIDRILLNIGVRAEHEVAWMREETDAMERFAERVVATVRGADAAKAALDAVRDSRTDSLHLTDVRDDYDRASEAFSSAVDDVMAADDDDLRQEAFRLLQTRVERETQITGPDFTMVGRG